MYLNSRFEWEIDKDVFMTQESFGNQYVDLYKFKLEIDEMKIIEPLYNSFCDILYE